VKTAFFAPALANVNLQTPTSDIIDIPISSTRSTSEALHCPLTEPKRPMPTRTPMQTPPRLAASFDMSHATNGTSDDSQHVASFWHRFEQLQQQDILKRVLIEVCEPDSLL
jgi:hypothetical protein